MPKTATPSLGYDANEVARIGATLGLTDETIASHQERLAALVPPEWKAERYIHRQVAGRLDFERFDLALATRHNVLMPGPTGAGKTTACIAHAARNRAPYASVEFSGGYDHAAIVGATRNGKNGLEYMFGIASLVMTYGGHLDLSDCNLAPSKFMSPMFPALDQRQIWPIDEAGIVIKKHPNTLVFGSYNPGYVGTSRLNEAFVNRFGIQMFWGYDDQVEDSLIGSRSPTLLEAVRRLRIDAEIGTDIGTNVMEEFITFATHDQGDVEIATLSLVNRFPDEEQEIVRSAIEAVSYTVGQELGVYEDDAVTETTADEADDLTEDEGF